MGHFMFQNLQIFFFSMMLDKKLSNNKVQIENPQFYNQKVKLKY